MLLSLFKNTYHCILLTFRFLAATITSTELQGPSNMMLYNLKLLVKNQVLNVHRGYEKSKIKYHKIWTTEYRI